MNNVFTNEDCMKVMARYPDGYFDLAIVDPPYGINVAEMGLGKGVGTKTRTWGKKGWDNNIPDSKYFDELFRVSKNQIIWGGNYFHLPPSKCVLIWDKMQKFSGADFELCWTSFESPSKAFRMSRVQAYTNKIKVHPTQKPVALYKWLLTNYAKEGDLILDTHVGSASSLIACEDKGFSYVGCELDPDYFDAAQKRLQVFKSQTKLF